MTRNSGVRSGGSAGFNLRLWFALSSFVIIFLTFAGAAFWLAHTVRNSLLDREAELSQEFLEAIVSVNGAAMLDDAETESLLRNPMLLDFAEHILRMPGVHRVSIHARSGRVLWSTEAGLIGKVYSDNDELKEAFAGELVAEISDADFLAKTEHINFGDVGGASELVESYIPLRAAPGSEQVIGVVEFYREPLSLGKTIAAGERAIWIAAILCAATLFLTLHWIVWRGARVIENQQEQLSRMEASSAIGQMASAVAHSLRNPMATIRSTAELWRAMPGAAPEETADEIISDIDRMDRHVRDLLAYVQSEPYHLQPVDVGRIATRIVERLAPAIQRQHIVASVRAREAGSALADEMLLEQALTTLVTNAVEAMPRGGELAIDLGPAASGQMRIVVADSGPGLPPGFEAPGAQKYFTTKASGLGLGLVLTRGIIERFGGTLSLANHETRGARAIILLDRA